MSRYPNSLDEDGVREVWVKENSGSDFVQTVNAYGGERKIKVPAGLFTIPADLTIYKGLSYVIEGRGTKLNRYDITGSSSLAMKPTILYFEGVDLLDDSDGVWNNGWEQLTLKNLAICLKGVGTAKGAINARCCLHNFDDVIFLIRGSYVDNAEIMWKRGTGAVGRTAVWRNVVLDVGHTAGLYTTSCRINFDTFLWQGGGILTNITNGIADTRIMRLETTMGSKVSCISTYREAAETNTLNWFWLTPIDAATMPYIFEDIYFYGRADQTDVLHHFQSTEGNCNVRLVGVVGAGAGTLKELNITEV